MFWQGSQAKDKEIAISMQKMCIDIVNWETKIEDDCVFLSRSIKQTATMISSWIAGQCFFFQCTKLDITFHVDLSQRTSCPQFQLVLQFFTCPTTPNKESKFYTHRFYWFSRRLDTLHLYQSICNYQNKYQIRSQIEIGLPRGETVRWDQHLWCRTSPSVIWPVLLPFFGFLLVRDNRTVRSVYPWCVYSCTITRVIILKSRSVMNGSHAEASILYMNITLCFSVHYNIMPDIGRCWSCRQARPLTQIYL